MVHPPFTTARLQHNAERKGSDRLANLRSSSSSRRAPNSEDDLEVRAQSVGRRLLLDLASSSGVSMSSSIRSSINRVLASRGYAMSFLSRTDSAMSGIPGPGRTIGELLWGAGRRLEPVLDWAALTVIGTFSGSYVLRTPNRARLVIDQVHVKTLRRSWTRFADPKTGLVERPGLTHLLNVSTSCLRSAR
jgi:hypothetical protein